MATETGRASWPSYAAKFLLALGVAVVGAAATITAAVADDRVTAQEWWAIVLAVILGLGGSYGVYKVPNNYAGRVDGRHELGGSTGGGPTDTRPRAGGIPTLEGDPEDLDRP